VIETGHLLRLAFGRPWRQTEGLLRSLTVLLGVDIGVPDHTTGSVRARASKRSLRFRMGGCVSLRGFQDAQHGRHATEKLQSAATGGNVLVMAGARAKKVAEFVVGPAEPGG